MVTEITPAEFSTRLQDEEDVPAVLDVQPRADYERWHVPESEHLDVFDDLETDPEAAVEALSTLPDDREVIVACTAGEEAVAAAEHLEELGYDVKRLGCHRP